MRWFDYTRTILRHHVVYASLVLTRRQMNDMFDDYESHLVPEEARGIIAESDWSYVEGYIRWFFRVSYPYMVHAGLGDPLRPAHQDILEEKQTQLDHVEDVLPKYHRMVEITRKTLT
ncbi:unnamed protein product [Lathyrus oleraceus]